MRTSGETARISDEAERVQSVSFYSNHWFHILSTYIQDHCRGIYVILLCVMSIEVTGETRVRTDCLNFDVFLCIAYKLKDKFQLGEEGISYILLWDFRSRYSSRLHKITYFNNKCTPTVSERYHQWSMLPAL